MAIDEATYGFNRHDTESLLACIGGGDQVQRRPMMQSIGLRFIRFELTADLTTATTAADIFDINGSTIASGATIEDPETIFTGLTATTRGIGVAFGDRFFIVNANCPAE